MTKREYKYHYTSIYSFYKFINKEFNRKKRELFAGEYDWEDWYE